MKRKITAVILLISLCISLVGCGEAKEVVGPYMGDGVYLFVGQDLASVGGVEGYSDGYIDYFGMPRGVTTYTNISSMDGLYTKTNYGAGDIHASVYLEDEAFADTWLAIGLYMVNNLHGTIAGNHDKDIQKLADFIIEYENPVFLRIGYEFDGSWNHYDPEDYKEAYIYLCDKLDEAGAENC